MDEDKEAPPQQPYRLSAILRIDEQPFRTLAILSSASFLTGSTDGVFHLWERDLESKQEHPEWKYKTLLDGNQVHGERSLCFCLGTLNAGSFPTYASGGSDNALHVWNTDNDRIAVLKGHTGNVNSVIEAPNGDIISGSYDGYGILVLGSFPSVPQ